MGGKGSGGKANKYVDYTAENSKIAGGIMDIMAWEKPDRNDIEGLYKAFGRYIQYCIDTGYHVGNLTAYMAMGLNKRLVHEWETGKYGTDAHRKLIADVKAVCATFREQSMAEGSINPVTGIWWQKNFDEFKDVQEVVVAPSENREQYSIEDIRAKYIADGKPKQLAVDNDTENDVGGVEK